MSLITVPSWEDKELDILKEKRIARMVRLWEALEPLPCAITLSLDMGYRCFVYPPPEVSDETLHFLLAWFVRRSAKKFERSIRPEGTIIWTNDWSNRTFEIDGENIDGQKIECMFILERFKANNCRIVEEEQIVKVKKLVCDKPAETAA